MNQPKPPKIGQGALLAAARQGLKELAHVLKAFPDSIPHIEEIGQIGTATPQAISNQTGVAQRVAYQQHHNHHHAMNHPEPIQPIPQPETEIAPPEAAPAPSAELSDAPDQGGILDQIMESVQSMPEPPEYEQEISQ